MYASVTSAEAAFVRLLKIDLVLTNFIFFNFFSFLVFICPSRKKFYLLKFTDLKVSKEYRLSGCSKDTIQFWFQQIYRKL